MNRTWCVVWVVAALGFLGGGCATAPNGADDRAALQRDTAQTLAAFKLDDPDIQDFAKTSAGYAIFPNVGKGGLLFGGAYGRGVLYEGGHMSGWCDLSQATVGGQIGGQAYDEIIFLENQEALNRFKGGQFTFAAQASAVVLKSGAAANAKYQNGVVAFTRPGAGLMAEATLGGQSFSYRPQ